MGGDKLERVKQDSIELINTLLSDSNNRAFLVIFDTNSEILSDFTNDKDVLVNLVNGLNTKGNTNYYQALVNVDSILKNYTPSSDKETIVLFLTDGFPNEDVPNEESYFEYLKSKYPYIVVNGIQYEMGNEILEPIKKVSDNQYLADMNTLNNVLFDASVVSILYENFILTDYIDIDNFYVESINDIKVSQGTIDFNQEEQKITWTIDYLRTGSKPTMTIDIKQKEESKSKELVPTNKKETVVSKIDTIEENVTSDKTPILKDHYQVIYEGNAPSGCTISNIPSTKSYNVFNVVEIENNKPTCEGYQFKGWEIATPYVKRINDDYFEMPEGDVTLKAEWGNMAIAKSMNGEVYQYIPPVLQKIGSSNYYKELWIYKSSITKLVFQNEIKSIPEATKTFDISEEKNGGVMGYLVPNTDNTSIYTAYIQGDEGVIANQDSSYLFSYFSKLETIEGLEYLDTSNVTNMSSMFYRCGSLTSLDLSNFNTSNVTNMSYMFFSDSRGPMKITSLDLSSFDTSKVTDMSYMFQYCSSLPSLDLSNFDTSNVTDMSYMFQYCSGLTSLDVSNFDTSKVTDMYRMFYNCSSLTSLDVSNFDTSNITTMSYMFYYCESLTSLDLNNFNTSNVENMSYMFSWCSSLISLDVSNFDTSNLTTMGYMFYDCISLKSLDVSHFNTSKVTDMSYMFGTVNNNHNVYMKLTSLDLSNFDTSNVTNMSSMFYRCGSLTSLDLSHFDTSKVTNMNSMFSKCRSLTSLDVSSFDTSNVTNMGAMFYNCSSLPSLDVSNFDTSNVTNMGSMFSYCSSLANLDLSGFNTSNVTYMHYMFGSCSSLPSLDVSNFDTSKVTDMSSMFSCDDALGSMKITSLDVSNFDTSNVTDMSGMFSNCSKLTSLDLSNFDTSNVTDMRSMFNSCSSLPSLDLSSFNTSNVTNMSFMFSNCSSLLSLDVSNFDTSNVTDMHYMFRNCSNLTTTINIYNPSVSNYSSMFTDAATNGTAQITVNYIESTSSLVDQMIATKSSNSNVVKGIQIPEYSVTITGNDDITADSIKSLPDKLITLSSVSGNYIVTSFKMNGTLVTGNQFTMPNENVTITNISVADVIQSEHNPYPNSLSNKVYGEKTYEGATSLTVTLDYQTQGASYDYIYLYDSRGNQYGKYGGTTRKIETLTILGDYIKIDFTTNASSNDYYGFKAIVIPNYDSLPTITVVGNDDIETGLKAAPSGEIITLSSISGDYEVTSFEMNGTLITGNQFTMPNENVTITNISVADVIQSEHNPYPNSLSNVVYGEKTYEGATSLTVTLDYQTESTSYDWIYLYDSSGKSYGKYGGTTRKTETIIILGNYIKVVFRTDSSGNNYYGFKATVVPNYN